MGLTVGTSNVGTITGTIRQLAGMMKIRKACLPRRPGRNREKAREQRSIVLPQCGWETKCSRSSPEAGGNKDVLEGKGVSDMVSVSLKLGCSMWSVVMPTNRI